MIDPRSIAVWLVDVIAAVAGVALEVFGPDVDEHEPCDCPNHYEE